MFEDASERADSFDVNVTTAAFQRTVEDSFVAQLIYACLRTRDTVNMLLSRIYLLRESHNSDN